jgi:hypothetical protein
VEITFDHACTLVGTALKGTARQDIVAEITKAKDLGTGLLKLRDAMRANTFKAGTHQIFLDRMIRAFDGRTRTQGFHILHDWDGASQQVNPDVIPVDVLHFLVNQRGSDEAGTIEAAILLDYYFMHVLALLSMRIWDDGDANANFDRLNALLAELQGPGGSGQLFADDAETLMLIGTSHYEPHEWGYGKLLDRVRTLNQDHQFKVGLGHASSMGCHLRFGFEAQCGRDTLALRDDNIADYPWLCFALAAVMREYDRRGNAVVGPPFMGGQQDMLVEAVLNGLTPDARAFVGVPPASLSASQADRAAFLELFTRHNTALLAAFERFRPSESAYSPLSFFFNFSHNVVKGAVIDALLWGQHWDVTLNDLLSGPPRAGLEEGDKQLLASTLMGYARSNPDRIRGRLMPVIVYDPQAGRRAYTITMEKLTAA